MTVTWNLQGETSILNDSVMVYIGVYAYGETRIELTVNPCDANIFSFCPLNESVPIQASGAIPIAPMDIAGIPQIAYSIPDFEGQAILRIFSNSTESQIACYSAVLTNGATFSHPAAVGSTLGAFAAIALVTSLAVAIYGTDVPSIRNHYAHSLSVFVVFSVFQHIFFTGALSMNWPSVLVAFWSNYAWAAGMIYSEKMQNSINQFLGSNKGNISMVGGAAAVGVTDNDLAGGFEISEIYKRGDYSAWGSRLANTISRRATSDSSTAYPWHGYPVKPGLPLPGNYSGFAGTLAQENIPASNAFMTGLLWFLALIGCVAVAMVLLKVAIEGLTRVKILKADRWHHFRTHWLRYVASAVLRTVFIGFYMMIFLTLFQFTFGGSAGVLAVAAVVFAILVLGMAGCAGYALWYHLRWRTLVSEPDRLMLKRERLLFCLPWFSLHRRSQLSEKDQSIKFIGSLPWWRIEYVDKSERPSVQEDEDFLSKFGWLYARFRRTRWFFFAVWLVYEFVRACFFGAAAGHPLTQVFGILAVEFIALITIVWMRPFEATRLNALMVYLLGFSKVSTVALSSAFDPRFNLDRITTTVIGIVIIIIQGVLTIFLLISVVIGAITSYMSLSRYREEERFRPRSWRPMRAKYLAHVEKAALDLPPPPPPPPEEPREPSFNVHSVLRYPKIEDEDEDNIVQPIHGVPPVLEEVEGEDEDEQQQGRATPLPRRSLSIRSSMSYSSLPYGARPVRASWSSRDVALWHEDQRSGAVSPVSVASGPRRAPSRTQRASNVSLREPGMQRANSRSSVHHPLPRSESPATGAVPEADQIQSLPSQNHVLDDVYEEDIQYPER
ncbi:hypothetical protein VTN77DRAFT_5930 [Rasamsonia byssochlamydoides]|uniref:uncharacterized protein n=1 Tax=Rasamsonia byssochlamydoides TaxID=89139 RepID=UPI003743EE72